MKSVITLVPCMIAVLRHVLAVEIQLNPVDAVLALAVIAMANIVSSCQACFSHLTGDPRNKYDVVMHPLDTATTDEFSPCTQTQICSKYPTIGRCLGDPSSFVGVSSGICGNGIKEANEECDCGLPSECRSSTCCDATTCKLKSGAKCSDSNDDCCLNCQPKVRGVSY